MQPLLGMPETEKKLLAHHHPYSLASPMLHIPSLDHHPPSLLHDCKVRQMYCSTPVRWMSRGSRTGKRYQLHNPPRIRLPWKTTRRPSFSAGLRLCRSVQYYCGDWRRSNGRLCLAVHCHRGAAFERVADHPGRLWSYRVLHRLQGC